MISPPSTEHQHDLPQTRIPAPFSEWREARPYVLPFFSFLALLGCQSWMHRLGPWEYPVWVVLLSAILFFNSRSVLSFRPASWVGSIVCGAVVFAIWIAPDQLIPHYRESWIFQNSLFGHLGSSIAQDIRSSPMVLFFRSVRAVILVPIIEELFWRAFLMRWLIRPRFRDIPLGTYRAAAFWITALMFASEHGPFWEVGLLAGIAYNWWMIRTRSLPDCILAHAVTNGLLSAFVILSGQWVYWQ